MVIKPYRPALSTAYGLNTGLVLACPHWERGGTLARDLAGHYDLTINGATWGTHQPGACLTYDGTNDYASTPTIALGSTKTIFISFWLWWDAFADTDKLLFETSTNYNSNTGAILINPNSSTTAGFWECSLRGAAGYNQMKFPRPTAARWNLIVLGLDANIAAGTGQWGMWVNGVQQAGTNVLTSGGNPTISDQVWYLMSRAGASNFGAGKIADFRVWRTQRALSGLRSLYDDPWAQYRLPPPPLSASPGAFFDLNSPAEGATLVDLLDSVGGRWHIRDPSGNPAVDFTITFDGDALDVTATDAGGGAAWDVTAPAVFLPGYTHTIVVEVELDSGATISETWTFEVREAFDGTAGSALVSLQGTGQWYDTGQVAVQPIGLATETAGSGQIAIQEPTTFADYTPGSGVVLVIRRLIASFPCALNTGVGGTKILPLSASVTSQRVRTGLQVSLQTTAQVLQVGDHVSVQPQASERLIVPMSLNPADGEIKDVPLSLETDGALAEADVDLLLRSETLAGEEGF